MSALTYFIAGVSASGISRLGAKLTWFYLKPRLKRGEEIQKYGW